MKKILLGLLTIGLLVGCTSIGDEKKGNTNDTNKKEEVSIKKDYKYFDFGKEILKVFGGAYFMSAPKYIGFNMARGGHITFKAITKDEKEIGFQLSTTLLVDSTKSKYDTLTKISQENSKMSTERDLDLLSVEIGYYRMNYNFDFTETTIDGRRALLDKGVATEQSNNSKTLNYAMLDFFIDKEGYFPCEVIVTSSDGVDVDELEAIARELISTIQAED